MASSTPVTGKGGRGWGRGVARVPEPRAQVGGSGAGLEPVEASGGSGSGRNGGGGSGRNKNKKGIPAYRVVPLSPEELGTAVDRVHVEEHAEGKRYSPAEREKMAVRAVGLSENMRKFLAVRLLHVSDMATAEAIGVNRGTPKQWLVHYPAFKQAYERLMASGADAVMDATDRLLGKASAVIEGLLDHGDWPARAKGVELVFRARGLWNTVPASQRDDPATASVVASMAALAALAEARRRQLETSAEAEAVAVSSMIEGVVVDFPISSRPSAPEPGED